MFQSLSQKLSGKDQLYMETVRNLEKTNFVLQKGKYKISKRHKKTDTVYKPSFYYVSQ